MVSKMQTKVQGDVQVLLGLLVATLAAQKAKLNEGEIKGKIEGVYKSLTHKIKWSLDLTALVTPATISFDQNSESSDEDIHPPLP